MLHQQMVSLHIIVKHKARLTVAFVTPLAKIITLWHKVHACLRALPFLSPFLLLLCPYCP
jgi:hypothetical protein